MLQKLSEHRKEKIRESAKRLGDPASASVTSDNRGFAKSWLNGLGIPSHLYESATLETLEGAYQSCSQGYGGILGVLRPAGAGKDIVDAWKEAAIRAYDNMPSGYCVHDPRHLSFEGNEEDRKQSSGQAETSKSTETTTQTTTKEEPKPMENTAAKTNDTASSEAEATQHLVQALEALQKITGGNRQPGISEQRVIELIRENTVSTKIEIKSNGETRTIPEMSHKQLPDVLKAVQAGCNVMMVGPAGSGKTTIANQIAKAMDLPFYFNGALSSEYKLTGFIDANGRLVRTAFREAYEKGGVYLFDEIDGSMPDALLAFNAALSNGHADFPDGTVEKHKNFHCVAAANTYGRGADRIYVGRSQMDGASLDRFVMIDLDYDEKLEKALAGNDDWSAFVQSVRKAVASQHIRHIVSPRASIDGAKLLAAGMGRKSVESLTIWKGLDKDSKRKIENAMAA